MDGISPKGNVVWYSVAREVAEDDVATIVRRAEVKADEDGDGAVQFDLDGDVPLRSIWVAVDLATGEMAVAAPAGYPLRRAAWRGRGLARGNPRADRVEDVRAYADLLLVRPGQGAWKLTVGDGSASDDDGTPDGRLAAALDHMTPIAAAPAAPDRFAARDVVVLIDPNRMELTVEKAAEVGR